MSFLPTYFGAVALPSYAYKVTGGPATKDAIVRTLGGSHDADGTENAEINFPYALTHSCLVYSVTSTAADYTPLGTALETYRAFVGKRERLWVAPWAAPSPARWAWARCTGVEIGQTVYNRNTQPVSFHFQVETPWYGTAYGGDIVSGGYLFGNGIYYGAAGATTINTSPKSFTVANAGNYRINDCGLTIVAGAASITYIKITVTGISEFAWSGTLTTGNLLTIDCGAAYVQANNVDGYSGFALTSNHVIGPWLRLQSGNNTVVVTITGGSTNSYIQFSRSDTYI